MANIPIELHYVNSDEFFKKCLINQYQCDSSLEFSNVCTEIANTWHGYSERNNCKTWIEIESLFAASAGESETRQKCIAIKVKNTNSARLGNITFEWLPYDATNMSILSNLSPQILVYLFPQEIYHAIINGANRNEHKLGLCARLAKKDTSWVLYLMVYANDHSDLINQDTILFTETAHAGGGNSGVRIPPLG